MVTHCHQCQLCTSTRFPELAWVPGLPFSPKQDIVTGVCNTNIEITNLNTEQQANIFFFSHGENKIVNKSYDKLTSYRVSWPEYRNLHIAKLCIFLTRVSGFQNSHRYKKKQTKQKWDKSPHSFPATVQPFFGCLQPEHVFLWHLAHSQVIQSTGLCHKYQTETMVWTEWESLWPKQDLNLD